MTIAERLWARLEPLGWTHEMWSGGSSFFAPTDDGTDVHIRVTRTGAISLDDGITEIFLQKNFTAWADGLRAVADVVQEDES